MMCLVWSELQHLITGKVSSFSGGFATANFDTVIQNCCHCCPSNLWSCYSGRLGSCYWRWYLFSVKKTFPIVSWTQTAYDGTFCWYSWADMHWHYWASCGERSAHLIRVLYLRNRATACFHSISVYGLDPNWYFMPKHPQFDYLGARVFSQNLYGCMRRAQFFPKRSISLIWSTSLWSVRRGPETVSCGYCCFSVSRLCY